MNTTQQIIEAYKSADFEKRLNLFLSHRSLRDQFAQIDDRQRRSSAGAGVAVPQQEQNGSWVQRMMLRWLGA